MLLTRHCDGLNKFWYLPVEIANSIIQIIPRATKVRIERLLSPQLIVILWRWLVEIFPRLTIVSRKLINAYSETSVNACWWKQETTEASKLIVVMNLPIESIARFGARAVERGDGIAVWWCTMTVMLGRCTISTIKHVFGSMSCHVS